MRSVNNEYPTTLIDSFYFTIYQIIVKAICD